MKRIVFEPHVPAAVRAIDRETALRILAAIHRYAQSGQGDVNALTGELSGSLRLRVADYRVIFDESADTLTIHRIAHRGEAYR